MKKIIFIVSILFSITSYSQVASGSFIVLNEGAEQDYLNIEELWQVYHQVIINLLKEILLIAKKSKILSNF